jgi:hypothetical protein
MRCDVTEKSAEEQETPGRCVLFHDWDEWTRTDEVYGYVPHTFDLAVIGNIWSVSCLRCGRTKIKIVYL